MQFGETCLNTLEIGEAKLGIYSLDVALGSGRGLVVAQDVAIFEGADDVDNGVAFADIRQEFVAEAFAGAGTLDESGDVGKFNGSGDNFVGVIHIRKHLQALIGHRHDTGVRLDGGERIIGRQNLTAGQDVEQGGFADIWQTNDGYL